MYVPDALKEDVNKFSIHFKYKKIKSCEKKHILTHGETEAMQFFLKIKWIFERNFNYVSYVTMGLRTNIIPGKKLSFKLIDYLTNV